MLTAIKKVLVAELRIEKSRHFQNLFFLSFNRAENTNTRHMQEKSSGMVTGKVFLDNKINYEKQTYLNQPLHITNDSLVLL